MSSSRSSSLTALATLPWPLFLASSALVATVWLSGFGPGTLEDPNWANRIPNAELRTALALFTRALDPVWITLGAINVYLATARAEGLMTARRWCGMVSFVALLISGMSAITSWPLGAVYFPANLGMKLGPVPLAFPFLWLLIVTGIREGVQCAFPRLPNGACALVSGVGCGLTSWLIDPVAWKYRAWWLWHPTQVNAPSYAPFSAYVTWLVSGCALTFLMRSSEVAPRLPHPPRIALSSFLIVLGIFTLTRAIR